MTKKKWYEHVKPYIKDLFLRKILQVNLSPQAIKLLLILKGHKNSSTKLCNPSQALLAIEMGKSIRSIQRYLKELIEAGIVAVERMGRMMSNRYHLLIDDDLEQFKKQYAESKEVATNIKDKCNKYINKNRGNELQKGTWDYTGRGTDYYTNLANKLLGLT
ncbi:helix-turn-helix domain-containing protein [Clostridium sp. MSJ-11]|uniref:Helix-turn-helix domain-containing protein n=1 Tax=Clostridium mobile TaxID=2841512 RepID=A0ABS6EL96_9CLOT|nr:helix-turn-helix domain-containing protein [Clostridium mobile]MBU5485991.1 helix-turn-helix domain-containing protein [Clostridium mobile]